MHRRKALSAVGGWDETFITSQDSDLSMRLLKAGYRLYRHPATTVKMHKRSGLKQWWKMGHRYGFWRTKVLLKHPKRAKWQEFLPLAGLFLSCLLIGLSSPWALFPLLLYGLALMAGGAIEAFEHKKPIDTSASQANKTRAMAEKKGLTNRSLSVLPLLLMGVTHVSLPPLQSMFELEPLLMYGYYALAILLCAVVYRRSGVVKDFEYNRAKAMRKIKHVYEAEEKGVWSTNAPLDDAMDKTTRRWDFPVRWPNSRGRLLKWNSAKTARLRCACSTRPTTS